MGTVFTRVYNEKWIFHNNGTAENPFLFRTQELFLYLVFFSDRVKHDAERGLVSCLRRSF